MTPLFRLPWIVAGTAAAAATLPGSMELLMLSAASLLPGHKPTPPRSSTWKIAVVIPAHNEETGIESCIRSLSLADRGNFVVDIVVIADNCTDKTAAIAAAAGARVLTRTNDTERGKGYALHYAFTTLAADGHDGYLIVDADTEVAQNFIVATATRMQNGAPAVQARYLVSNLEESVRTRLMGLALRAFNVVRPLGREKLSLSAGILGNGFGLTAETLRSVPYLASSVVEDLEYHLSLVRSGRRVAFVNETTVYGEMPVHGKGVKTQRSRWEGGRLRMLVEKSPDLARRVLGGDLRMLEPLLELLLLPLAFHVALLCVAATTPLEVVRWVAASGFAIIALHLAAAILVGGGSWRDALTLLAAPFYILWKLLMVPALVRNARSNNEWVRTSRNAETDEGRSPERSAK